MAKSNKGDKPMRFGEKVKKPDIGREEFMEEASPIPLLLGGQTLTVVPRGFSTGSYGYSYNNVVTISVNNKPVRFVVGLNMTVQYSKPDVGKKLAKPLREADVAEDEE